MSAYNGIIRLLTFYINACLKIIQALRHFLMQGHSNDMVSPSTILYLLYFQSRSTESADTSSLFTKYVLFACKKNGKFEMKKFKSICLYIDNVLTVE